MDGTAALCAPECFRAGAAAGMFLFPGALLLVVEVVTALTALEGAAGGDAENRPKISSSTVDTAELPVDGTLPTRLLMSQLSDLGKNASESNSVTGCGLRGGLGLPARSDERGTEDAVCSRSGEPGVPAR